MSAEVEKALKVITEVCAKFTGNLADHQVIQAALKTITDELAPKKAPVDQAGQQA